MLQRARNSSLPVTSQEVVDREVMKPEVIQQELEHLKQNMHISAVRQKVTQKTF
jgi:hypothetical protein